MLCGRRISLRLKKKFYRTTIKLTLLYGTECWAIKRHHIQKMSVAEIHMFRRMCENTIKDKIQNMRRYVRRQALHPLKIR